MSTAKLFAMEDLKARVEENAVATMGMLMPEETLKNLVGDSIDRFFTATETFEFSAATSGTYYSSRQEPAKFTVKCSAFDRMVWTAITPMVEKHLEEFVKKENETASEAMTAVRAEYAEKLRVTTYEHALKLAPILSEKKIMEAMELARAELMSKLTMVLTRNRLDIEFLNNN